MPVRTKLSLQKSWLAFLLMGSVAVVTAQAQQSAMDGALAVIEGMPIGAQKLLHEKAVPPEAPLRLITFRGAAAVEPKGDAAYGVNPLLMKMLRLKPPRPEKSSAGVGEGAKSPSSNTGKINGSGSGSVSVKAIHQHINDTVHIHGGEPDESITPTIKPPGVHILDTVTREFIANKEQGFEKKIPAPSADESISRAVANLEKIKPGLPADEAAYAQSTQDLLNKIKGVGEQTSPDVDPSKPDVSKKVPDVSKPDINNQIPDVTKPDVDDNVPDISKQDVDDKIPGVSKPDVDGKVPDVNNQIPDDLKPDVQDDMPDVSKPDVSQDGDDPLTDDYNRYVDIKKSDIDDDIPAVSKIFPQQDVLTPDVKKMIDFAAINKDISNINKQVSEDVSVDDIKKDVSDALAKSSRKVSGSIDAKVKAVDVNVDKDLAGVADKVASAVGSAFDHVQSALKAQGDAAASAGNAVSVPDKKCRWFKFGGCWGGETSSSKAARASAKAQKSADYNRANQFYYAANQMPVQKAATVASIYQKFAGAEVKVDTGVAPSVSGSNFNFNTSASGNDATGGVDASSEGTRPDYGHVAPTYDESSVVGLVTIDLEALEYVITDVVNASIGDQAIAEQYIAEIDTVSGDLDVGYADWLVAGDIGSINAAIGYKTHALQIVDSIYDELGEASVGSARFTTANTGEVNVAIGANSSAEMLVTSIMGTVKGDFVTTSVIAAPVNVALGDNTTAISHLGAWQGVVEGSGSLTLQPTAALSATIGERTSATVRLASQKPSGRATTMDIAVVSEGSMAAPLGYDSTATVEMGNVDGVTGRADVSVISGPVIAAALGSSTNVTNRLANLEEGRRVGGSYSNHVKSGGVLAFALGDRTSATNALGSVEGDIDGSANISVTVGEVATGTLGVNTLAETYVGSVLADVSGNVDIDVVVGAINTFAVGLSASKDIYAKTYIGTVTSDQGSVSIDYHGGAVFNLGFGLVIPTPFGTLDFSRQGCVKLANHGSAPC